MRKKFDMRYASERTAAAFAKRNAGDEGPPPMYRADLLRAAKNGSRRYENPKREIRFPTGREFRDIAADTKLSVNTVREAIEGNARKLDTLWILANYFGIPWLQLFDVDKKLAFDANGKPSIAPPAKKRKLKNGEVDLSTGEVGK